MKLIEFIRANQGYFEDFVTRSIYHSNRIEGSTLSYAETYAIVFNDNSFKVNAAPREIYEAINLKYALAHMMDRCSEPLTQDLIKQIGILINKNINEIDGYRRVPVMIRGAEYVPPAPGMLPSLMMQFVYNYEHTSFSSPFERAAQAHIDFERIHPFSDGNGRTGRVLINFELLKNDIPPIVVPAERRAEYFKLIASYDVPGMTEFFKALSGQERERIEQFQQAKEETPEEEEELGL